MKLCQEQIRVLNVAANVAAKRMNVTPVASGKESPKRPKPSDTESPASESSSTLSKRPVRQQVLHLRIDATQAAMYYPNPINPIEHKDMYMRRRNMYKNWVDMLSYEQAARKYDLCTAIKAGGLKEGKGVFFKPWIQLAVNRFGCVVAKRTPRPEALQNMVHNTFQALISKEGSVRAAALYVKTNFDSNYDADLFLQPVEVQNVLRSHVRDVCMALPTSDVNTRFSRRSVNHKATRNLYAYVQINYFLSPDGKFKVKIGHTGTKERQRKGFRGPRRRLESETTTSGYYTLLEFRHGVVTHEQKKELYNDAMECGDHYTQSRFETGIASNTVPPPKDENLWLEFALHRLIAELNMKYTGHTTNNCHEEFLVTGKELIFLINSAIKWYQCQVDFNEDTVNHSLMKCHPGIIAVRSIPMHEYNYEGKPFEESEAQSEAQSEEPSMARKRGRTMIVRQPMW